MTTKLLTSLASMRVAGLRTHHKSPPLSPVQGAVPATSILDWTCDETAAFFKDLSLPQYSHLPQDYELDGSSLVHLDSECFRDLGIKSVGHRLLILRSIYERKLQEGLPIDDGDYIPPFSSTAGRYAAQGICKFTLLKSE